jgi:hypothetical protein
VDVDAGLERLGRRRTFGGGGEDESTVAMASNSATVYLRLREDLVSATAHVATIGTVPFILCIAKICACRRGCFVVAGG